MARRKRKSGSRRVGFARATRTVYRTASKRARRAYSRGRSSGWLPLSGREMGVSVGTGAALALAVPRVMPYVSPYTEWAGRYQNEVVGAGIGILAHRFGSGIIKDMGREAVRASLISTGAELATQFTGTSGSGGSQIYN